MSELCVQKYLRGCPDPEEALRVLQSEPHNVRMDRVGDLVLLNYDITTHPTPLTNECRALLLRVGTWDVVSCSFKRFFNWNEASAAPIDWSRAVATEKLDGSLVVVYHDGVGWNFHTRGSIGARGEVPAGRFTFRERILATWGLDEDHFVRHAIFDDFPQDWCWVFEYVGPYNRIVTPYETERLILITVVDRRNRTELRFIHPAFETVKRRPFDGTLDGLVSLAGQLPKLSEGFVVYDPATGNRVKVKNPAYLAIARTVNAGAACTDEHFAAIALQGDTAEIRSYFPELSERIDLAEATLADTVKEAERLWGRYGTVTDRKEFALSVKHARLSPWLFCRHQGKTALCALVWARENLRPQKLADWMKEGIVKG